MSVVYSRASNGPTREAEPDTEDCCIDVCDQSTWAAVFKKYDVNNEGFVEIEHLKELWAEQSSLLVHDFPPSVLEEILERCGYDQRGRLTYHDFERMMRTAVTHKQYPRFCTLVKFAASTVVAPNRRATFVRSYLEEYTCVPPPLFTIIISIVQVLSHFIQHVDAAHVGHPSRDGSQVVPCRNRVHDRSHCRFFGIVIK